MKKANMENNTYPIIPRKVLFDNPDKVSVKISPNGNYISYLAPKDGVLNIFVASKDKISKAKPITDDKKRGITSYFWSFDNSHIFYVQDKDGDENWQLHKVNIEKAEDTILTPQTGVRTEIIHMDHKKPNKIIIGLNNRSQNYHDLYEIDIETNEKKLIFTNNDYLEFTFDNDSNLRFLLKMNNQGDHEIYTYTTQKTELFLTIPASEVTTTNILGFDKTGRNLYMTDSSNSNTSQLIEWNLDTNEKKVVFHNKKADISNILAHPTEHIIQGVSSIYLKNEWKIIDNDVQADFEYLEKLKSGEVNITSQTLDNKSWIVAFMNDDEPVSYYLYERESKKAEKLFTSRLELAKHKLSKMQALVIKSRDGLELVSYLTLPLESLENKNSTRPKKPIPLVLLVHGGPSARDNWGLNTTHQWLSNRGYGVLSVNYRGSTGFGKKFFVAGNGEWYAKMHNDLIDAVNWTIKEKIADKTKIAIYGGSYGGYATLVGLTKTPDVFACGIDIVGPSNLMTLINSLPPYWEPGKKFLYNIIGGDPTTPEGKKIFEAKSPINFVSNIKKPLLIGQGANDQRVKQDESDQIVNAMKEKNIPVTYILFPDEGHGFQRPENNIAFKAVTEGFLAKYLEGKFEPIKNDFYNSSIDIVTGKDFVEGIVKH